MFQSITLKFFPEYFPLGEREVQDVDYEEVEIQEPTTREDYED